MREGLLQKPIDEAAERELDIGYSRLASTLETLGIGVGKQRYGEILTRELSRAEERIANFNAEKGDPRDAAAQEQFGNTASKASSHRLGDESTKSDFGHACLKLLKDMLLPVLELAPATDDEPDQILQKAVVFLETHARADSRLDRLGRNQLLSEIETMRRSLSLEADAFGENEILDWLAEIALR